PIYVAKAYQHAIDRLFIDCAADEKCNAAYPDLKGEYAKVLAHLEKEPQTFEVENPITKAIQQVTGTRNVFVGLLRPMFYSTQDSTFLPVIIHLAYLGDYRSFARAGYIYQRGLEDQLARGLYLSINCAESVPFTTEADIARETAGTFMADTAV